MSESVRDIRSKMAADLEWREFEEFVSDLWELQGYSTEVTGHHDREGEDIIATQEIPYKYKIFIQTKRNKLENKEGKKTVQIYCLDQGADADLSVIITTSSFTAGATSLANLRENTKLVDGEALAKLVKKLNAEELLNDYLNADDPSQVDMKQYRHWANDSTGLRDISGIGQKYEKELAEAGIQSVSDLVEIDVETISKETGIAKSQLERWITEAAYQEGNIDVVKSRVPNEDVEVIMGIGPYRAEKLKDVGIKTIADLAVANHNEVAQKTEFTVPTLEQWAQKARYFR